MQSSTCAYHLMSTGFAHMKKRRKSANPLAERPRLKQEQAPKAPQAATAPENPLNLFHPAVKQWFRASFGNPTAPQAQGWPAIARGDSTLILAPTGTGKTLAAFLWCINRLMFEPLPSVQIEA